MSAPVPMAQIARDLQQHGPPRDGWTDEARCRSIGPTIFAADAADHPVPADVRACCAFCPVRLDCIGEGVTLRDRHMHRGGLNPDQVGKVRRSLGGQKVWWREKRPPPIVDRPPGQACGKYAGTPGGHTRHRRAGEAPCSVCLAAKADYQRDYRRRKRMEAAS
jgi:hypothetical protein